MRIPGMAQIDELGRIEINDTQCLEHKHSQSIEYSIAVMTSEPSHFTWLCLLTETSWYLSRHSCHLTVISRFWRQVLCKIPRSTLWPIHPLPHLNFLQHRSVQQLLNNKRLPATNQTVTVSRCHGIISVIT